MRDDFTEGVKHTLASRVNNLCSNPYCQAPTSGPQLDSTKALNLGVAAHITAASPGGARYNPSLTSEQRSHINNGIYLCQICAKLVDNDPARFPEEVLRGWKVATEHHALTTIGKAAAHVRTHESESQKKMRKILEWGKDKHVTLTQMTPPQHVVSLGPKRGSSSVVVLDCTEDYVTIGAKGPGEWQRSISLDNIVLSYDDQNKRPELQERYS